MKTKTDAKKKIQKIKELVRFRNSLIAEIDQLDDYQEKVEKVISHYNKNGKTET